MLSFKEIKELIDLVSERRLAGLEIERAGFRLRVDGWRPGGPPDGAALAGAAPSAVAAVPVGGSAPSEAAETEEPGKNVHVITSPIVGTFYRAPSPEAGPFAEVGERIAPGKILCIIESMKLMNEIESDVEGEILEVFPRNGQPVEYGEKLFAIRLAA